MHLAFITYIDFNKLELILALSEDDVDSFSTLWGHEVDFLHEEIKS